MKLQTITQVTRRFQLSTRTLRYYEQLGLIQSQKKDDYAYRVYSEDMILRLEQILLLKELKIPLKKIREILETGNISYTLSILEDTLEELTLQADELLAVKAVLEKLMKVLKEKEYEDGDTPPFLFQVPAPLSPPFHSQKQEVITMSELKSIHSNTMSAEPIRILYLPSMTVASVRAVSAHPEDDAGKLLDEFVCTHRLYEVKPDLRVFGFNSPSPTEGQAEYGYEFWVTIPEEMKVPAPCVKKHFEGGLYAAHCIKMGDFQEWGAFSHALKNHSDYEVDHRAPEGMCGCLEEHLNAYEYYLHTHSFSQLDLLTPVKRKG